MAHTGTHGAGWTGTEGTGTMTIEQHYGDDTAHHEAREWAERMRAEDVAAERAEWLAKHGKWAKREARRTIEGPSMARLVAAARKVAAGPHAGTLTGQRAAAVLAAVATVREDCPDCDGVGELHLGGPVIDCPDCAGTGRRLA
jgi:hypothetical protein